jgi:hypothetical protein
MPDQGQKEKSDFEKDHPNVKLNEWAEEEIDIPVINPVVDEKNKRVSFETATQKVKQKVYYSHSTPRMVICSSHFFLPLDPKKYIFKCRKCDYHFKANTLTHKYVPETGKIVFRLNGQPAV